MTTLVTHPPKPRTSIFTRHGIVRMRVPLYGGVTVKLLLGEGWAVWVCGEKRWRAEVGEG